MSVAYRVRNWGSTFENSECRKYRHLSFYAKPNKHDGLGMCRLKAQANWMALYGAWVLILDVASRTNSWLRGWLVRDGRPLSADDLAVMTGGDRETFENALKFFVSANIGWLEEQEIPVESPGMPEDPPGAPGDSPGTPEDPPGAPAKSPDRKERRGGDKTGKEGKGKEGRGYQPPLFLRELEAKKKAKERILADLMHRFRLDLDGAEKKHPKEYAEARAIRAAIKDMDRKIADFGDG